MNAVMHLPGPDGLPALTDRVFKAHAAAGTQPRISSLYATMGLPSRDSLRDHLIATGLTFLKKGVTRGNHRATQQAVLDGLLRNREKAVEVTPKGALFIALTHPKARLDLSA